MCTLPLGVKCLRWKEEREVDMQRDRGFDIPYFPVKSLWSWCHCAVEKHLFRAGLLGWRKGRVSAQHMPRLKRDWKGMPEIIHKAGKFLAGHDYAESRLLSFRCTQSWEVTLNSFPQPFSKCKSWKVFLLHPPHSSSSTISKHLCLPHFLSLQTVAGIFLSDTPVMLRWWGSY